MRLLIKCEQWQYVRLRKSADPCLRWKSTLLFFFLALSLLFLEIYVVEVGWVPCSTLFLKYDDASLIAHPDDVTSLRRHNRHKWPQSQQWTKFDFFISSHYDCQFVTLLWNHRDLFLIKCKSSQNMTYQLYTDVNTTHFPRHLSAVRATFGSWCFHTILTLRSRCWG